MLNMDGENNKPLRRNKKESNQLKQDILDVAERQFKEYGYEKTTLQMIADELNVTHGAIVYHFKNKHMILYDFFGKYTCALTKYVYENPPDDLNKYLLYCIAYLKFFREIMKQERNRELFFQRDHLEYWVSGKLSEVERMYRLVADDFHKRLTEKDVRIAAVMDVGAKLRLYEFFQKGDSVTAEDFCYYQLYIIGEFSKLDEATIQRDMQRAYEYVDSHEMPTISLLD